MSCKTVHTTCPYCGVGCGIEATVDESTRVLQVQGLEGHPANRGRLCSKGTALADTIGLEERLLAPEVNGQVVDWDRAIAAVAEGLQAVIDQHGPDAVAFYLSGQLLTEDYYVANKLMKGFIGSANIDTNSRLCMSSSVMGHKRAFGTDTVPGCYEDFEQATLITLVGSNAAWCHPVLFQRIRCYKEANPGVKVVVIDPRRTQTCDIADLHLPIALGADSWLFNGLLYDLASRGRLDEAYIKNHCQGFAQSLAAAEASSPSVAATASACGLDERELQTFYDWYAEREQSVTLYSQGVNQSSSGTDKVNSIINCHLATGRIGRPGMGPFSMTGQPNAMGGREVGGLANTLASHLDFNAENIDRLQRFWGTSKLATRAGLTAVELFDAIDDGRIKAVWIVATNPVVSMPNADKARAALEKCQLVIVSDCIRDTDTTRLATIKLPATGWSEKDGTVTNSERCVSRQRGLLPAAGGARHDWWIITQVAKRMGFAAAFDYGHPADIFKEHAALSGFENNDRGLRRDFDISALQAIDRDGFDKLEPFQWPLNKENPRGKRRFFAEGGFFTSNRKANFIAIDPRRPQNQPSASFPLRLNTGRIRDQWHSMTRTALAPQLNQHINEPFVEMHPSDARAQGLHDRQLLRVTSRWGEMMGRLIISEAVRVGDCFVPIHWSGQMSSKGRVGAVVNPVVDPVCRQPESKHTPVQVSPYDANWHGLLLTRERATWPAVDYVVEVKGQQHDALILADSRALPDPLTAMTGWLPLQPEWALLSYQDPQRGHHRLAAIDQHGLLQAVFLISSEPDLPASTWLGGQFERAELDLRTRQALLSGRAPAGEDVGRIICACFSVGEKTIAKAIEQQQLATIDAIGECLKAGTSCGSCVPEIKTILAKRL